MHLEAHLGLGWVIGVLATRRVPREPATPEQDALAADRRLRAWCVGASVLPDVDAVAYLWGPQAYGDYHHTFGHNVFLGVALALLAGWRHRAAGRRRAVVVSALVALCFGLHLLTDMKLSAYSVHLLWPVSRLIETAPYHGQPLYRSWPAIQRGFEFRENLGLGAPINSALVYLSFVVEAALAWWRGVSPLELISPRVDRMVLNALRDKPLACGSCATDPRPTNERCDACRAPVCSRHGRVHGWFRLACPGCATGPAPGG